MKSPRLRGRAGPDHRVVPPGLLPALPVRPALSDRQVVALAAAVWCGATASRAVPVAIGVGIALVALVLRRPWLVVATGLVLGSALGYRSVAGLEPAVPAPFAGNVTLLSDPQDGLGATSADVRLGHRRLELTATGSARGGMAARLAGERLRVVGRIRPPPPYATWLSARHVVGVLESSRVEYGDPGAAPWRAANVLRRTLDHGTNAMRPDQRSLFMGLVLGDDRDQAPTLVDDFRGSGLTHLLAVSGENVAFVLAMFGPLLRRLRLAPRWLVSVSVISFFMLLTRFEPSVIRAGVMAGLAATAFLLGRPASGLRLLALAVSALVLIDPLLIRSIGFQLSVAASAGILLIAPALRRRLPGPASVVEPLAITAGAQAAVAPLLIAKFGGLPVASLPANLLAGPAAGFVMTWGLGAGVAAGLLGGHGAVLLHVPTTIGLSWIAAVARVGAAVPLGELRSPHLVVISVAVLVSVAAQRWEGLSIAGRIAGLAIVCTLLAPTVVLRSAAPGVLAVPGGELSRAGGGTVLVVGSVRRPQDLLEALRRAGVRRIDLLVFAGSPSSAGSTLGSLAHRWAPALVWVAGGRALTGARTPQVGTRLVVGEVIVTVDEVSPGLVVHSQFGHWSR